MFNKVNRKRSSRRLELSKLQKVERVSHMHSVRREFQERRGPVQRPKARERLL